MPGLANRAFLSDIRAEGTLEAMATFRIQDSTGAERICPLDRDVLSFGRSSDCDLVINTNGISRRHGQFMRIGDGRWCVQDLASKNGIFVNGRRITHHILSNGDQIAIGAARLVFCADQTNSPGTGVSAVTISDAVHTMAMMVAHSPDRVGTMDARRLSALFRISKQLLNQRDTTGLIDVAFSALIDELDAEVVVFGLTCDPEGEQDRLIVRPAAMQSTGITLSRSVLRRTIEGRQAVLVSDTGSDEFLVHAQSIVAGGIRSALCVPMMDNDRVSGFIYVDHRHGGRAYLEGDLEFASAVGAMVGTAIENARLHEAELIKQRMEAELASARRVQRAILPSSWIELEGWDIFGQHTTCREVGGDYYDAIMSDDGRLWFIIADVCGKGVPAALLASSVHTAVHVLVDRCQTPAQLLDRLNKLLLKRNMIESSFITCLAVSLIPGTGGVLLASAGHPHPIYIPRNQPACTVPMADGLLLGIDHDATFDDTHWSFPESAGTLFMYTDGLSESFNEADEQFGEERLLHALSPLGDKPACAIVSAIQHDVQAFRGNREQSDDLTVMACRRIAASPNA